MVLQSSDGYRLTVSGSLYGHKFMSIQVTEECHFFWYMVPFDTPQSVFPIIIQPKHSPLKPVLRFLIYDLTRESLSSQ